MKLSRFELRRFRGFLPRLALIFAMLVPVFYGAIYLAANWDPQGHMGNLPVALVNEDKPVAYQGKRVQAGQDFTTNVVSAHQFQWHLTTRADADSGLDTGRYYLEVVVPSNFSANLVSGSGSNPQRAVMILRRNDANGYVIGSLVGRAQQTIEEAVNQSADNTYFKAVFGDLAQIRTGMVSARDGAGKLATGLQTAKNGSAQLKTGATSASTGATQLSTGATSLNTGMKKLATGASNLTTGLDKLSTGSQTLATGAGQVAGGTQELYDTVVPGLTTASTQLATIQKNSAALNSSVQTINKNINGTSSSVTSNLATLNTALTQLASADPQVTSTKAYQDAVAALTRAQSNTTAVTTASNTVAAQSSAINTAVQKNSLGTQLTTAKTKITALNTGAHQVATGANSLHTGIVAADQGSAQLQVGIASAQGGAQQLATGASTLATGLTTLKNGITSLDNGNATLLKGAQDLEKGLAAGVDRLPVMSQSQQDKAAEVMSSPADVQQTVLNPARVYGRGLAPLFFSIGIWVFGISGFLVMRPVSGRLLSGRMNPVKLTLSAWLPFGIVAVSGSLLMLATVWVSLGLDPVHPLGIILVTALVAVTFSLIAHLLRMALGLPGSALLLVWLILQLASTGGTYPKAVLPAFFQWINPLMPITYSIDAYRVLISGGLASHLARDVGLLACVALGALVLDVIASRSRQRFTMEDLHPSLEH